MHARIHLNPRKPGHISLRGTKINITLLFFSSKCRPTDRIRESYPRVKIIGLAGQGDPTRMKPVSHGSLRK